MLKSYDRFEKIRQDHTLTDDEIMLLTQIATGKDNTLEDPFNYILSEVLKLRNLSNDIDSPQKASDAKKYVSNENRITKFTKRIERLSDQWEKQDEIIAKAEKKKAELYETLEGLNEELGAIQEMQNLLGPERLNELSSKYMDDLYELMNTVLEISEILGDDVDLEGELPYLSVYMQEYIENGELNED